MKSGICRIALLAAAVALSALTACLGPGPTGTAETKPDSSTFTARIDGDPWLGSFSRVTSYGIGYSVIHGTQLLVLNPASISISLYNVTGTGTFPLGTVNGSAPGGFSSIVYTRNGSSWRTPSGSTAGTVTISLFAPDRLAGTFEFTATPDAGYGPNRIVTEGKFDLPVTRSATSIDTAGHAIPAALTTPSR